MKSCSIKVRDTRHSNSTDPFTVLLGRNSDQRLAHRSATGSSSRFCGTPVSFIHLHYATEMLSAGAHHCLSQFVKNQPGRLVTAKSENSLETKSAHTILLTGHVPHRPKPNRQLEMGALEYVSRKNRNLHPTATAVQKPIRHWAGVFAPAARAPETIRPTKSGKILATCGFVRKTLLKFGQCSWIVFDHQEYTLHLGAC